MATYALTFATRAAFDTSLASGDIYNLMQGVTSSKPSVAITATITESGETFACGTNVMVDIKSVGPGDRVMYDSTNNKFFGIASKWIDNNYPNQPTQHIMIFKTGVLPARYVDCGVCIRRYGNRIRLASGIVYTAWSTSASSGYAWLVSGIPSDVVIRLKSRVNSWFSYQSTRYSESVFPSGSSTYRPITRGAWNTALSNGEATVTQNGATVTLADYNYVYDNYAASFHPLLPSPDGVGSQRDGRYNTKTIVADFIANHGKTAQSTDYAAGFCDNYSVNAPGLGKHAWFLGTLIDICDLRNLSYTLTTPSAWGSGIYWSCSQANSTYAWVVNGTGLLVYVAKNVLGYGAVPLADLILEN